MSKYIIYQRVSTQRQGVSGLGLEAQKHTAMTYLESVGGDLLESYTDIESGSKNNRPELQAALRKCRLTGATLLIAKLDRLSRDRRFLLELQDSSIQFVCCDMPEANNFTIGIMACLAEYEREMISERTKAALKAAKARGVVLGNPNLQLVRNNDTTAARASHLAIAATRNAELKAVALEMKAESDSPMSLRQLADAMNAAGYKTSRGCEFKATSINRVLAA